MKWIYLPKPRKRHFLNKKNTSGLFHTSSRRSSPKSTYRLVNMIVGMFMFWIFVQIGFFIPLLLTDSSALSAMQNVDGISLPESKTRTELIEPRLAFYFVIDNTGRIEVEGEELPSENTVEYLEGLLFYQARGIALMIIDKDTPMKFITPLLLQLQEAGINRIMFSTAKESPYEPGT